MTRKQNEAKYHFLNLTYVWQKIVNEYSPVVCKYRKLLFRVAMLSWSHLCMRTLVPPNDTTLLLLSFWHRKTWVMEYVDIILSIICWYILTTPFWKLTIHLKKEWVMTTYFVLSSKAFCMKRSDKSYSPTACKINPMLLYKIKSVPKNYLKKKTTKKKAKIVWLIYWLQNNSIRFTYFSARYYIHQTKRLLGGILHDTAMPDTSHGTSVEEH